MKGRPGEDETVEQGDGDAGGQAGRERLQRAARRGAVNVERLAIAREGGRDHEGLVAVDEAEVADERLVEDGVDGGAVVRAARGEAMELGARGRGVSVHAESVRRDRTSEKVRFGEDS